MNAPPLPTAASERFLEALQAGDTWEAVRAHGEILNQVDDKDDYGYRLDDAGFTVLTLADFRMYSDPWLKSLVQREASNYPEETAERLAGLANELGGSGHRGAEWVQALHAQLARVEPSTEHGRDGALSPAPAPDPKPDMDFDR